MVVIDAAVVQGIVFAACILMGVLSLCAAAVLGLSLALLVIPGYVWDQVVGLARGTHTLRVVEVEPVTASPPSPEWSSGSLDASFPRVVPDEVSISSQIRSSLPRPAWLPPEESPLRVSTVREHQEYSAEPTEWGGRRQRT